MTQEDFIKKFMLLNMELDKCEDSFMIKVIESQIETLVKEYKTQDDEEIVQMVKDHKEASDAMITKMAKMLKKSIYEGFYQGELTYVKSVIKKYA